eukprot:g3896.t1
MQHPMNCLIVDDDPMYTVVATGILSMLVSGAVETVASGRAGLRALAEATKRIDVVLLDLNMPDVDGLAFMRAASDAGFDGGIIITSGETPAVLRSAEAMGKMLGISILGVLRKPLTVEALKEVLAKASCCEPSCSLNKGGQLADDAFQLTPYYQPQYAIHGGQIVGLEALIRLTAKDGRVRGPAELFSSITTLQDLTEISLTIARTVLRDSQPWRSLPRAPDVSINFDASVIEQPEVVVSLQTAVMELGVDPRVICLEVTEKSLPKDASRLVEALTRLRMLGFRLSLDDYGMGASSFELLRLCPFSEIKVDRSIIEACTKDNVTRKFLHAVAGLARDLELVSVAEGVENQEELDEVRRAGIDRVQGCRNGHMALMTALLAPLLIGVAGGAIDVSSFIDHKTNLQDVADAAALAAAKEASLNGWSTDSAVAVVNGFLDAHKRSGAEGSVAAAVAVDPVKKQVEVTLEQDHHPYFVVGYFVGSPQITVSSAARTNNASNICVIGLEGSDTATVSLQNQALISAPKCAVYSNSTSTTGLTATGKASLVAQLSCSAGGYSGAPGNFAPQPPLTDCPAVADPLSSRPPPPVGACDKKNAAYVNYSGSLAPGVYCGGLSITAASQVTLKPGIYIIKDGPLIIESASVVEGRGVGFYFTGKDANFVFGSSSQVDIEAPTGDWLAGLVAFQDRSSPETDFIITSNKARKLLGTIYLPNGNLIVDANNKVADESAYTAIVVRRLRLSKAPNLVLNTNYDKTLVPVPEGVGPQATTVYLLY